MDQGDYVLTEVTMSVVFMGKKQGSLPVKTTDIVISDYIMNGLQLELESRIFESLFQRRILKAP